VPALGSSPGKWYLILNWPEKKEVEGRGEMWCVWRENGEFSKINHGIPVMVRGDNFLVHKLIAHGRERRVKRRGI